MEHTDPTIPADYRQALARERDGDSEPWGFEHGIECVPCRGWARPSCVAEGHEIL